MTRLNPVFQDLVDGRSTIGIIAGKRGSGKSGFGYRAAELYHDYTGDYVYVLGFPPEKRHLLPSWIEPLEINEVERAARSYVFVDEGALVLFARNFYSEVNKFVSMLLAVSRHYDISIYVATQTTSIIDLNILRFLDFLMVRKYSYYSIRFEREEVRPLIYKAQRYIGNRPDLGVVYGDYKPPMFVVRNRLPKFWNESLSKVWRLALKREREKRLISKQKVLEAIYRWNPDIIHDTRLMAEVLNVSPGAYRKMRSRLLRWAEVTGANTHTMSRVSGESE